MSITLTLNGSDLSSLVNEYEVIYEPIISRVVTTMDWVEHSPLPRYRLLIRFTLFPMSDSDTMQTFNVLSSGTFIATYTDPYSGGTNRQKAVRLITSLSSIFNVESLSGVKYYTGNTIELRAIAPGFGEEPQQNA